MREQFKGALFLFAVSTAPFLGQFHVATISSLVVILLCSLYCEIKSIHLTKFFRIAFIILYLVFLKFSLNTLWGLEAGVSFLSFLALLKSFELNNKRDLFIFSLIIQLSLVGHLLSVDDLYMVIVLILIVLNLFWLLYQFHHFAKKKDYLPNIGRYRKRVFAQVILWSLPLTLAFFFIFPRIPLGNIFLSTLKKQENMTGFTSQLRPGEISKVIQSKATYFRAQFKKLRPSTSNLYWRGTVLAKTDGFNWDRILLPPNKKRKNEKESQSSNKAHYNYDVEYEFFSNGPLFLLDRPKDFDVHSRSHTGGMGADTYFTVAYRNQKIRYSASSTQRSSKGNHQLSALEVRTYTQLGDKSLGPRFDLWLKKRARGISRADDLFNLLRSHFIKNSFSYSLAPGQMDSNYPLDDFFFNKKVGLCEHYASIVAYSLRRLGLPSRVVVGFQGGQYNPYGEYFYIQGKNAHSWIEYWTSEKGWQRADPTGWISPDRIRLGPDIFFLADQNLESLSLENGLNFNEGDFYQNFLLMADMLYFELNREFLNFDFEKQEKIFNFINLKGKGKYLKLLGIIGIILFFASMGLVYFIYYRQRRPQLNLVEKSLAELRSLLEDKGVAIPIWWGPQRMSAELSEYFSENELLKDEIVAFCKTWEGLRFRPQNSNIQKKDLLRSLKEIKRQIHQI